jgi:hypothetical protein
MSTQVDLSGNTITADAFVGTITGNISGNVTGNLTGNVTGTVDFPSSDLANPGTNLTAFDKALKITVNGTNYWIGLADDND